MAQHRKVKTIPATLMRFTSSPIAEQKKRRVAGYARVSTDHDDQLTSCEAQIDYYTKYIKSLDDWEFVRVYADEGITGTSTKRREGFRSMVSDAFDGKIDLVVNPEQAVTVRRIYQLFLQGMTYNGIAQELTRDGVSTPSGKGKKYHSGVRPFSSRIRCGECGCCYGSKVWHSNNKYRKVIWHCNHKYDGDQTCSAPHLTEEEVQAAFLRAANRLLQTRGAVIENGHAMIPALFDTTALEAEHDELLRETQVVSDMAQQCVSTLHPSGSACTWSPWPLPSPASSSLNVPSGPKRRTRTASSNS